MVLLGPDFPLRSGATRQESPEPAGHIDGLPLRSVGGSSLGHSLVNHFAFGGQMIDCLSGPHSHACADPDAINKIAVTDIANTALMIINPLCYFDISR